MSERLTPDEIEELSGYVKDTMEDNQCLGQGWRSFERLLAEIDTLREELEAEKTRYMLLEAVVKFYTNNSSSEEDIKKLTERLEKLEK